MTTPHTQRAHARLAPSASHRWMACPGSVRLEAALPEQTSVYAAEGTAAHELAAHCLKHEIDAAGFLDTVIDISANGPGAMFGNMVAHDEVTRFLVTEEMVDAVQVYLDAVRSLFGRERNVLVDVEQRLDMTHLHPEIYGTGDAVVFQLNTNWLHVLDLKYGKGVVVDPTENPQLMLYGAGAARKYRDRRIDGITLHIIQPRAAGAPVRSWQTDVLTLVEFEADIRAAANATEAADAPLVAGEHCRFCKAAPTCPTLRESSLRSALAEFGDATEVVVPEPTALSTGQLADVLRDADMIGNWVKAVQAYAHAEAIAGRVPPGFKLVPKRANRKWRDEGELRERMVLDFPEIPSAELNVEPKLKSPAQLEKTVGRKAFTALEDLTVKESSGMNLVPESDARGAVKTAGLLDFDATSVEN